MKPEYGFRKILWSLGLALRSDYQTEYEFRRRCQEKSYKYFYRTIELEAEIARNR